MYDNGEGVPQDYAVAVRWWRLAAEQGDASAQYNLALMYDNGEGVPQDYAEAVKWYRLAAEQGIAAAQVNLGVMYANGEGVPQDYRCARRVLADRHGSEPEKARKSHHKTAATACNGLIHAAKPHPTRPITGNRLGSAPRRKRKPSTASISGHQNAVPVRLLQQLQPLAE